MLTSRQEAHALLQKPMLVALAFIATWKSIGRVLGEEFMLPRLCFSSLDLFGVVLALGSELHSYGYMLEALSQQLAWSCKVWKIQQMHCNF